MRHAKTVTFLVCQQTPLAIATPGVSYVEIQPNGSNACRVNVDFSKFRAVKARVQCFVGGSEFNDPTTKGIEIYNVTAAASVCAVTWVAQGGLHSVGAWNDISSLVADKELTARIKGSSVTENFSLYKISLEIEYA